LARLFELGFEGLQIDLFDDRRDVGLLRGEVDPLNRGFNDLSTLFESRLLIGATLA